MALAGRKIIMTLWLLAWLAAGAEAAGGRAEDPRRLYREARAMLDRDDYNGALAKLLRYAQTAKPETQADTTQLLDAYYNIGGIYSVYSDFAQALEIYKSGYALSLKTGRAEMQFRFLRNMVGASCNLKKAAYAGRLNEMLGSLKGVDPGQRAYYYRFNRGLIAGCRNRQGEKARWMEAAIKAVDRYRLPDDMKIYAYSEIYQCYEKMGDIKHALTYLRQYDSLAHVMNQAYLYVDCYKGLMRLYTKAGDKENALRYQAEYFRYADSILNINEYSKIRADYVNSEKRMKDNEISNLEKTNTLQQTFLATLVMLMALAVGTVIVFYRQRQKLNAANMQLFKRNKELLEAESRYRESMERQPEPPSQTPQPEPDGNTAAAAGRGDLLHRIMEVMEDETAVCDPEFSLPVLAHITESNTTYVSQVINSTFGKNFRTFINEYRVKIAMKRMMDTTRYGRYSIQGIAESVGYKSASNFITAFKKMTGMTPSLYQKLSEE